MENATNKNKIQNPKHRIGMIIVKSYTHKNNCANEIPLKM